ncbi:MAG: NADH-quinone oxidoreductase subunit NuoE [Acidihalobacter sp.]|uniref:NADH-quinone oxidoreductase subunit NuoE n=1 Tax=Acidihalobacter sp. TaxID=1872108 RepID=UPI00307F5E3F
MLNEDEKQHLAAHIAHYPEARAGAIYTLQYLQKKYGHLHDKALREASELCGLSVTQLEELVSFYSLLFRRPVGKRVLRVCDSIACHMAGAPALLAEAEQLTGVPLGQPSKDGEMTVLPHVCLGLCDRAPAALFDESAQGPLDSAALAALITSVKNTGGQ